MGGVTADALSTEQRFRAFINAISDERFVDLPIDFPVLTSRLGLRIRRTNSPYTEKELSAFLIPERGEILLYGQGTLEESPGLLAHEIAHWLRGDHHHYADTDFPTYKDFVVYTNHEMQAEVLASTILVPKQLLADALRSLTIQDICRFFVIQPHQFWSCISLNATRGIIVFRYLNSRGPCWIGTKMIELDYSDFLGESIPYHIRLPNEPRQTRIVPRKEPILIELDGSNNYRSADGNFSAVRDMAEWLHRDFILRSELPLETMLDSGTPQHIYLWGGRKPTRHSVRGFLQAFSVEIGPRERAVDVFVSTYDELTESQERAEKALESGFVVPPWMYDCRHPMSSLAISDWLNTIRALLGIAPRYYELWGRCRRDVLKNHA